MVREERRREYGVNRYLRGAAYVWHQHDGHVSVAVRVKGPACHDGRHGASESDEHRHEASAGEADLTQQGVHDKGDSGHVAGVFQNGQEEKQHEDDRQEAQHASDAGEYAVYYETFYYRVYAVDGEAVVHPGGQPFDAFA